MARDARYPEQSGMAHAPGKPGLWVDPAGNTVDPAKNVYVAPSSAAVLNKSVWPGLAAHVPSAAELEFFRSGGGDKSFLDYLGDPKGAVSDLVATGKFVTSSAASLPEKLEATARAVVPFAAGVVPWFLPFGIGARIVLSAGAFVGARIAEAKTRKA